jgi:hypothetical protein
MKVVEAKALSISESSSSSARVIRFDEFEQPIIEKERTVAIARIIAKIFFIK